LGAFFVAALSVVLLAAGVALGAAFGGGRAISQVK
jgi:hypothetical protein